MHVRKYSLNSTSSILKLDRLQHDRHAACVIAQQYSSAIFVIALSFP